MKIVHIIFSFISGGAETMLVDIVNEQVNTSEVSIVIINKYYNKELIDKIDKRIRVFFVNRKEGSKNPLPIIRLNLLLLNFKPDVIHCHNHNIIPLFIPYLRKISVLTIHDVGIDIRYFKLYNKLFAISNIVKQDIKNRAELNAVMIYNGIHPDRIQKKEQLSTSQTFRILQVSRLDHLKKGQHIAIEAIRILKDNGINNIQLDLIGEGVSELILKDLVRELNLQNYVSFLGFKNRDFIYNHLKDYDLLLQPSIYEGFGLTVTEGLAAKILVLVSSNDGPMEVIENGKYGYFFESGNAQSLAEQIKIIIANYESNDMKQKIESAYMKVKTCFDIKETAKKYIEEYQKK